MTKLLFSGVVYYQQALPQFTIQVTLDNFGFYEDPWIDLVMSLLVIA